MGRSAEHKRAKGLDADGFTLLETIAVVVVAGILGALLATFVSTSSERSARSFASLQAESTLQLAMEDITAEYRKMTRNYVLNQTPISLGNLKSYAESTYASLVVAGQTGFTTFQKTGSSSYSATTPSGAASAGAMLLVTLESGGQRVRGLFSG